MGLKRYKPSADATITNAWKSDLETRATGSNTGGADILEIFHIYGAASTTISRTYETSSSFPFSDLATCTGAVSFPTNCFV